MIDIETIRVTLPLKLKFAVAGGETSAKTNVLTVLNNRYSGEAAASVKYGASIETIETDIVLGVEMLQKKKKLSIKTLDEIGKLAICSEARSALSAMVLHYLSGESKRYPWEILKLSTPVGIKNSITLSIDEPDEVIRQANESDFPIIKIKMGGEKNRELIDRLDEIIDKEIRVDANGGWSCEQAEEMIHYLSEKSVTVIEQPTSVEFIKDWNHLKGKAENVELIIDEGMCTLKDYKKFSEYVDGVNIKMEKSGGIVEAMKIAKQAHKDKKKVMLGCMVESSVGISQSIYMSSLADYHDLDAPQLLEDDIARGIIYDRDTIHVDREIIGGPALKRDLIEKYSKK